MQEGRFLTDSRGVPTQAVLLEKRKRKKRGRRTHINRVHRQKNQKKEAAKQGGATTTTRREKMLTYVTFKLLLFKFQSNPVISFFALSFF